MSIAGEAVDVASGAAELALHAAGDAVHESEERGLDLLLKVVIVGGLVTFVAFAIKKRLDAPCDRAADVLDDTDESDADAVALRREA